MGKQKGDSERQESVRLEANRSVRGSLGATLQHHQRDSQEVFGWPRDDQLARRFGP